MSTVDLGCLLDQVDPGLMGLVPDPHGRYHLWFQEAEGRVGDVHVFDLLHMATNSKTNK